MGSLLGFRPPHFSEEEAWLPAWLQPSSIKDASTEAVERPSSQGLEEIGCLQQNISTAENGNSSDDCTYKSLHLFLSGEDNSPMNFASCSSNVEAHFHLHLSSNEESEYSLNPSWSRSQADKSPFNQALLVQQPEAIGIPVEVEAYMDTSQQQVNLGIAGASSPSFRERKEVNSDVDASCCKADISNAIELTVAASEALTIHEVLKDELIATSILEAAIRVKQARLENFSDDLSSPIEGSNDVDCAFLSDLDHVGMADAYEDVGLTVTSHGDLSGYGSVSHVDDSFASETYISNAKCNCNERGSLEIDLVSSSPKQHEQINNAHISSNGSILEAFECATRKDHVDYESLGTENANLGCDVDPVFNCSTEQTDFYATEAGLQREGFPNGDLTSSHTILRSNEREDKGTYLVPDRFQSRWFGGWTCKTEVNVPAVTNEKYKRSVPELFADEMSSLSESADIAPDISSCMQRHDKDKAVSQSSIAPKYASEKANNNGHLISDDVAVSPTVSPVDPLCSVVPCSLTSLLSHNSKDQINLEKHLGPMADPSLDNLEVNGECSPTVRRHVASLKTYSMLYPSRDPYLDKEHTCGESSSFEHNRAAKADTELTSQRQKEMTKVSQKVESIVPRRKRVRFLETEISYPQIKKFRKTPQTRLKDPLAASRIFRRLTRSKKTSCSHLELKKPHEKDKALFHDLKFVLTGFSVKKHKQIKILIQDNGGMVFDDIPSPPTSRRKKRSPQLPVILCPKKLLTTKFLYGCAVNAAILNVTWLFDSVDEGLILPHQRYRVLKAHLSDNDSKIGNPVSYNNHFIFDDIAIMLHGKPDFCSKMAIVIKHGGGSVFKTFRWLVKSLDSKNVSMGVVVMEDENGISRQLKQCALEQNIPLLPFNWIISSLYAGRLLPSLQFELQDHLIHVEMSEEI